MLTLFGYIFLRQCALAVYTEVSHLLNVKVKAQQDFYEWVTFKGIVLRDINQHDMPRISELTEKYSDLHMDFTDATLVIAAEKTGIRKIISWDKDFNVYRLPAREKHAMFLHHRNKAISF